VHQYQSITLPAVNGVLLVQGGGAAAERRAAQWTGYRVREVALASAAVMAARAEGVRGARSPGGATWRRSCGGGRRRGRRVEEGRLASDVEVGGVRRRRASIAACGEVEKLEKEKVTGHLLL